MNIETTRPIRILTGAPADVEREVNELISHYKPLVWNIQPVEGQVHVTVVMVHQSELRQSQTVAMPVGILPGQRH